MNQTQLKQNYLVSNYYVPYFSAFNYMQRDFYTHFKYLKNLQESVFLVFMNLKMMNESSKRHS